jgi:hypothetical protein
VRAEKVDFSAVGYRFGNLSLSSSSVINDEWVIRKLQEKVAFSVF